MRLVTDGLYLSPLWQYACFAKIEKLDQVLHVINGRVPEKHGGIFMSENKFNASKEMKRKSWPKDCI